jgi:glycosyltransferase involved in cell wall biosynthesis
VERSVHPGKRFLRAIHRRGWVTWERTCEDARVLMVTNAWPRPEHPMHGIFVCDTVAGLERAGVHCDVLFIRGYRGLHCYLLGCVAMLLLARERQYALVNSHGGETALAARFYLGAPVIASYWGSDLLGPRGARRRTTLKNVLVSRLLRAHSMLMTATTTKSREMERVLPPRTRRRNRVIPDGVDRERFAPVDREAARREVGWPEDELTVISVGRAIPLKRLWLAERAVSLAARQVPRLRWRVVSDVPPEEMPLRYSAADCLIHTSELEGSPNVVKEALACNLPVVATGAGDIPELLAGVEPAAVCEPDPAALARAIVRCLDGGHARSNGRERSAHLDRDQIALRLVDFYRELGCSGS